MANLGEGVYLSLKTLYYYAITRHGNAIEKFKKLLKDYTEGNEEATVIQVEEIESTYKDLPKLNKSEIRNALRKFMGINSGIIKGGYKGGVQFKVKQLIKGIYPLLGNDNKIENIKIFGITRNILKKYELDHERFLSEKGFVETFTGQLVTIFPFVYEGFVEYNGTKDALPDFEWPNLKYYNKDNYGIGLVSQNIRGFDAYLRNGILLYIGRLINENWEVKDIIVVVENGKPVYGFNLLNLPLVDNFFVGKGFRGLDNFKRTIYGYYFAKDNISTTINEPLFIDINEGCIIPKSFGDAELYEDNGKYYSKNLQRLYYDLAKCEYGFLEKSKKEDYLIAKPLLAELHGPLMNIYKNLQGERLTVSSNLGELYNSLRGENGEDYGKALIATKEYHLVLPANVMTFNRTAKLMEEYSTNGIDDENIIAKEYYSLYRTHKIMGDTEEFKVNFEYAKEKSSIPSLYDNILRDGEYTGFAISIYEKIPEGYAKLEAALVKILPISKIRNLKWIGTSKNIALLYEGRGTIKQLLNRAHIWWFICIDTNGKKHEMIMREFVGKNNRKDIVLYDMLALDILDGNFTVIESTKKRLFGEEGTVVTRYGYRFSPEKLEKTINGPIINLNMRCIDSMLNKLEKVSGLRFSTQKFNANVDVFYDMNSCKLDYITIDNGKLYTIENTSTKKISKDIEKSWADQVEDNELESEDISGIEKYEFDEEGNLVTIPKEKQNKLDKVVEELVNDIHGEEDDIMSDDELGNVSKLNPNASTFIPPKPPQSKLNPNVATFVPKPFIPPKNTPKLPQSKLNPSASVFVPPTLPQPKKKGEPSLGEQIVKRSENKIEQTNKRNTTNFMVKYFKCQASLLKVAIGLLKGGKVKKALEYYKNELAETRWFILFVLGKGILSKKNAIRAINKIKMSSSGSDIREVALIDQGIEGISDRKGDIYKNKFGNDAIMPFKIEELKWEGEAIVWPSVTHCINFCRFMRADLESESWDILRDIYSAKNGTAVEVIAQGNLFGRQRKDWHEMSKDILRRAIVAKFDQYELWDLINSEGINFGYEINTDIFNVEREMKGGRNIMTAGAYRKNTEMIIKNRDNKPISITFVNEFNEIMERNYDEGLREELQRNIANFDEEKNSIIIFKPTLNIDKYRNLNAMSITCGEVIKDSKYGKKVCDNLKETIEKMDKDISDNMKLQRILSGIMKNSLEGDMAIRWGNVTERELEANFNKAVEDLNDIKVSAEKVIKPKAQALLTLMREALKTKVLSGQMDNRFRDEKVRAMANYEIELAAAIQRYKERIEKNKEMVTGLLGRLGASFSGGCGCGVALGAAKKYSKRMGMDGGKKKRSTKKKSKKAKKTKGGCDDMDGGKKKKRSTKKKSKKVRGGNHDDDVDFGYGFDENMIDGGKKKKRSTKKKVKKTKGGCDDMEGGKKKKKRSTKKKVKGGCDEFEGGKKKRKSKKVRKVKKTKGGCDDMEGGKKKKKKRSTKKSTKKSSKKSK
jgi:hypothetical protein